MVPAAAAGADAEHRTRALRVGLGGEAMTSVRYGEGAARAARLLGVRTPTAASSLGGPEPAGATGPLRWEVLCTFHLSNSAFLRSFGGRWHLAGSVNSRPLA